MLAVAALGTLLCKGSVATCCSAAVIAGRFQLFGPPAIVAGFVDSASL